MFAAEEPSAPCVQVQNRGAENRIYGRADGHTFWSKILYRTFYSMHAANLREVLKDDEARKILIQAGSIRTYCSDGKEWWTPLEPLLEKIEKIKSGQA